MVPSVNALPCLVLTRPRGQAEEFAALFEGQVNVILSPVQRIEPVCVAQHPAQWRTILVTSGNGVRALAALGLPAETRVFAVGDRTAELVENAGMQVVSAKGTVEDLLALCLAHPEAAPFWHLRGHHSRGDLAPRLRAKGLETYETICYQQVEQDLTREARALIEGERPVVLPLFSPRSAALVLEQARPGPRCICVAISKRVAEVAAQSGVTEIVTAQAPTRDAMAESIWRCLGLRV